MHHLAPGPIQTLRKIVTEVSANYVEMADKVLTPLVYEALRYSCMRP
jgi:hypothetical protein